jgi:hypothetical protein
VIIISIDYFELNIIIQYAVVIVAMIISSTKLGERARLLYPSYVILWGTEIKPANLRDIPLRAERFLKRRWQ